MIATHFKAVFGIRFVPFFSEGRCKVPSFFRAVIESGRAEVDAQEAP
ncbi:MAG: hypothetical protein KBT46_01605 [Ruminococcus sp.]|nr:hypothetical protein [Candidatus Copronaster equi]